MKGTALSPDKKRYLLHIYLTEGYTAAKPLAIKYGISPRTISQYAKATGHKNKPGRETRGRMIVASLDCGGNKTIAV